MGIVAAVSIDRQGRDDVTFNASLWSRALGRRIGVLSLLAALLSWSMTASAEPLPPEQVPEALRPWIPWVLDGVGDEACTLVGEARVCAWLDQLRIEAGDSGAEFSLRVVAERRTVVPLPGSTKLWPQAVKVDGDAASVYPLVI